MNRIVFAVCMGLAPTLAMADDPATGSPRAAAVADLVRGLDVSSAPVGEPSTVERVGYGGRASGETSTVERVGYGGRASGETSTVERVGYGGRASGEPSTVERVGYGGRAN